MRKPILSLVPRYCRPVVCLLWGLLTSWLVVHPASAQSAHDGFNPGPDGIVRALLVQPDGMILAGGSFDHLGGLPQAKLGRLHPDGTLDTHFNPSVNGTVHAIARQADGAILIGGYFSQINGHSRPHVARLDAEGSLDLTFSPQADGLVQAILEQPDGKILVGGGFTNMNNTTRHRLARLNADGSLDNDFSPDLNDWVYDMALLPDGKILVVGGFTEVNGETCTSIARLLPDGTLDMEFNVYVSWAVYAIGLQADGRILIGGGFNSVGSELRGRMARLHGDGSVDTGFDPRVGELPGAWVTTMAIQPDGKIVIGGTFQSVAGIERDNLARLLPDGTLDADFNPAPSDPVHALAVQPDGKLVLGGAFSLVDARNREWLARLYPCGTLDGDVNIGTLPSGESRTLYAIAHQPDGKILLGGLFSNVLLATRHNLARLLPDGSLDYDFIMSVDGPVTAIAVQPDAKILIGGSFSHVGGQPRQNLARLHPDGSLDIDFNPGAPGFGVNAFLLTPGGKIFVGGAFTNLAGHARTNVGLLHENGALDTTFTANTDGWVRSLARAGDGFILVGGAFENIGGLRQPCLAQVMLGSGGGVIPMFNPDINGEVRSVIVRSDHRILIGGLFDRVNDQPRQRLALLNADGTLHESFTPSADQLVTTMALQLDGRILLGGGFTEINGEPVHHLARLTASGLLDTTFNAEADDWVHALAVQPDGKVLVGGRFQQLAGVTRHGLGRLSSVIGSYQDLRVDATYTSIIWTHGRWSSSGGALPIPVLRGSGPEVDRVVFEISYDGTNWYWMGYGERMLLGGWTLTNKLLPAQATISIRGRAEYGSGQHGGSRSVWESVRQVFVDTLPELRITAMEKGPPFTVFYGPTIVDRTYWLQYAVDLKEGLWADVPGTEPQEGSGYHHWFTDETPDSGMRIYRIDIDANVPN